MTTRTAGSLWVTGRGTGLLSVDPGTGALQATIEIGPGAIDTAASGLAVWIADHVRERLFRFIAGRLWR